VRIKKNAGAKIAALLASLTALGGTWALVHQNPPASASAPATAAAPTSSPLPRGNAAANSQPKAPAKKKHTRTHVS
jgi:hypothetical protein